MLVQNGEISFLSVIVEDQEEQHLTFFEIFSRFSGVFHYCSKECQIKHWKVGHKHDCQKHWIQKFWKRNLLEE